jgi:transcriptional regulator with XRE-family HTH domain
MNHIRELRKKIGLSARRLAKVIGSNMCSIYHWEQGISSPRYPVFLERMNALDEFLTKLEENPDYLIKRE